MKRPKKQQTEFAIGIELHSSTFTNLGNVSFGNLIKLFVLYSAKSFKTATERFMDVGKPNLLMEV